MLEKKAYKVGSSKIKLGYSVSMLDLVYHLIYCFHVLYESGILCFTEKKQTLIKEPAFPGL
ncbi:TPA: hypothetical protein ACGXKU_003262 [Bacillus cereus]